MSSEAPKSPLNVHAESRASMLERLIQPGVNRGDSYDFAGTVDKGKVRIHYLTVPMKDKTKM